MNLGLTVNARNEIINNYFRSGTVYLGLFNSDGEVDTASYTRVPITFDEPDDGKTENNTEVKFPIAAENWGEIIGGGIFDDETGGTLVDDTVITSPVTVEERQQFAVPVGNYTAKIGATDTVSTMAGGVND